ncbi:hypothetical protein C5167_044709, partial [Papaver somniferum]
MYLQYYINDNGDKVYTVKKESPLGKATESAHPVYVFYSLLTAYTTSHFSCNNHHTFLHTAARFSPDDKYSRQRVLLKKRFGLLPTQKPAP